MIKNNVKEQLDRLDKLEKQMKDLNGRINEIENKIDALIEIKYPYRNVTSGFTDE